MPARTPVWLVKTAANQKMKNTLARYRLYQTSPKTVTELAPRFLKTAQTHSQREWFITTSEGTVAEGSRVLDQTLVYASHCRFFWRAVVVHAQPVNVGLGLRFADPCTSSFSFDDFSQLLQKKRLRTY